MHVTYDCDFVRKAEKQPEYNEIIWYVTETVTVTRYSQ